MTDETEVQPESQPTESEGSNEGELDPGITLKKAFEAPTEDRSSFETPESAPDGEDD